MKSTENSPFRKSASGAVEWLHKGGAVTICPSNQFVEGQFFRCRGAKTAQRQRGAIGWDRR